MNKKQLIIFGNSVIKKKNKNIYLINGNIAFYLLSLSDYYDIKLVSLIDESPSLQFVITNKKYKILACKNNLISIFKSNINSIIFLIKKKARMYFLAYWNLLSCFFDRKNY